MSTKTELAAVKAKIEQNHADRDAVVDKHRDLYTEQLRLEAKLADEQKPKLRHGDYGVICNSSEGNDGKLGMMILDRNDKLSSLAGTLWPQQRAVRQYQKYGAINSTTSKTCRWT